MLYFYDDVPATNSIRISNSEIAELDLVNTIKESDLDKYLKRFEKEYKNKDFDIYFYYDLPKLAEDYDCEYVMNDEFGSWYTNENRKHADIWKKESKKSTRKSLKESIEFDFNYFYELLKDDKNFIYDDKEDSIYTNNNVEMYFYVNKKGLSDCLFLPIQCKLFCITWNGISYNCEENDFYSSSRIGFMSISDVEFRNKSINLLLANGLCIDFVIQ